MNSKDIGGVGILFLRDVRLVKCSRSWERWVTEPQWVNGIRMGQELNTGKKSCCWHVYAGSAHEAAAVSMGTDSIRIEYRKLPTSALNGRKHPNKWNNRRITSIRMGLWPDFPCQTVNTWHAGRRGDLSVMKTGHELYFLRCSTAQDCRKH